MNTSPAIFRAIAASVIALAVLTASCGTNGSFESDPDAVRTVNVLTRKLASGGKLTPEEYKAAGALFEKYPGASVPADLYQKALIQREDWATLEKVLTSAKGTKSREDRILLGKVYIKLGYYSKARDVLTSLEPPLDAETASMLGAAYFHTGESDKAAATLDSVWPDIVAGKLADGIVLRGLLHFYKGENQKAIEVLNIVLSSDPDSIPANNAISRVYAALGDEAKAEEHLQRVRNAAAAMTAKENAGARMVEKLHKLQEAYRQGNHKEVIRLGLELESFPDQRNRLAVYNYLYNSYTALGMTVEANKVLVKAKELRSKQ